MAKEEDRAENALYAIEKQWLHEFAYFYGGNSTTTFSEDTLNGISLVEIIEALTNPHSIWCEKCDGPGTVCVVEAIVGDDKLVRIKVHFSSQEMSLHIISANQIEEYPREKNNAA